MWSKLKQAPRSGGTRAVTGIIDMASDALPTITACDCLGFFRGCGYTLGPVMYFLP